MTREERLARLHTELKVASDGVFVVGSDQAPILDHTTMQLDRLLTMADIGNVLRQLPGDGPIELQASKGISDEMLKSINHRRDQLHIGRAVLLVFDPADCARVSRIADDLWKWATIVELDPFVQTWDINAAQGVIDSDRYAPALRPGDVIGPQAPLTAPLEDSDP